MALDLSSLQKAVMSLERALNVAAPDRLKEMTADQQEVIRAGVIQNFELAYELCWKFMKRWLETNLSPMIADGVTRRELFRLAVENRLIDDVEQWMIYHDARNQTAHIYDLEIAQEVYETARGFVRDARKLLQALESRND
ncbi:nucleotidyltransferase substrate binding protein [Candidatus Bipolaricaulota bacterium]|nr:nucleotidyltransferase substrate binding protein [Candidatus Bipolaricaulota bacterium]